MRTGFSKFGIDSSDRSLFYYGTDHGPAMSPKLIALSLPAGLGLSCPQIDAGEARPPYRFLRYDEDYRFLADPAQWSDFFDWIKYVPLQGAGFLSFGGEVRERFETYGNESFQTDLNLEKTYFLKRFLFYADYHPSDSVRVFAQCKARPSSTRRRARCVATQSAPQGNPRRARFQQVSPGPANRKDDQFV